MSRAVPVVLLVLLVGAGLARIESLSAQEPEACPLKWMIGKYRYTDTLGESSLVRFTRIDDQSIRDDWKGDAGEVGAEVAGWHTQSHKIVIAGFESDGSQWHLGCPTVTESGFSGQAVVGERDGKEFTGEFSLEIKKFKLDRHPIQRERVDK